MSLITKRIPETIVAKDISFTFPESIATLKESYGINLHKDSSGHYSIRPFSPMMQGISPSIGVSADWEASIDNLIKSDHPQKEKSFCESFGNFFVTYLRTEDRLRLVNEISTQNMYTEIGSPLQMLYFDQTGCDALLSRIFMDAFGRDIRLDESGLSTLTLRIGERFNDIPPEAKKARPILSKYEKIDDQGDGIKSFVATVLSMLLVKRPITLIDEPEVFLHPPQAFKLGEFIANYAKPEMQTIIVTHSSDLLRGIISRRQDVIVIRMDRVDNYNKMHLLDPKDLEEIFSNPLLSSSRILDSIFYRGAVIVEADSDSAFYQRIARRIRPSDDINYANAYNKQTVFRVAVPYKKLGIKFAVIVDFDAISERVEYNRLITEMGMSGTDRDKSLQIRDNIARHIEAIEPHEQHARLITSLNKFVEEEIPSQYNSGDASRDLFNIRKRLSKIRDEASLWSKYKDEGYLALPDDLQKEFLELNELGAKYGIFIVPYGELESWLTPYGVEKNCRKSTWIVSALTKIPEIPIDETAHLWKFIIDVHEYLLN